MKTKSLLLTAVATIGLAAATMGQNFNWVKQIGGTSSDFGYLIKKDTSGNFIIVGNYSGTIDLNPGAAVVNVTSSGNQDIFITKLDPSGNFLWGKSVGGSNTDAVSDLIIENNGNIYLCGFFRGTADFDPSSSNFNLSTGNIGADGFILKLNSNGNLIYAKQVGGTTTVDDHVFSIGLDNQGNLYATGYFNNTCDMDPGTAQLNITSTGGPDVFIIKLDVSGNFVFARTIGNSTGSPSTGGIGCNGYSLIINNGFLIISGIFDGSTDFDPNGNTFNLTSNGQRDCFILKLDLNGNFIFAKSFGGSGNDYAYSISSDQIGNIIVGGTFINTVDFDPSSNVSSFTSNGSNDGFILKLSNVGNYIWCNQIGGTGQDLIFDVSTDANDNIFLTGYFSNTVDFDNSSNQYTLTSNGMKDAFLAAYSSSNNLIYAQNYGSTSDDEGVNLFTSNNEIYLTGYFQNTVDFNQGTSTSNLTSFGVQDAFALSITNNFCTQTVYNTITIYDTVTVYTTVTDTLIINTSVTGINPPNNVNTIKVFPNPASTHITIDYGNFAIMNGYQLRIENSLGQQVFQTNITQQTDYLSLATWGGNGIYFVRIIDQQGNTIDIRKIVLQ
jgi:hypothetical protein